MIIEFFIKDSDIYCAITILFLLINFFKLSFLFIGKSLSMFNIILRICLLGCSSLLLAFVGLAARAYECVSVYDILVGHHYG